MAHVGIVGKRMTVKATFTESFSYEDFRFNPRGDVRYTHIFHDADGNPIVWKTTNPVEYLNGDYFEFIPTGALVEMTFTVKEHGQYKEADQTVATRCKFKLIERESSQRFLTKEDKTRAKAAEQLGSLGENDFVWEMPYAQYKAHYSDCETVAGSYDGDRYRPYIKVIIRDGRLKKSGVRGKCFDEYRFSDGENYSSPYRAVSEENARKRFLKEHPDCAAWFVV